VGKTGSFDDRRPAREVSICFWGKQIPGGDANPHGEQETMNNDFAHLVREAVTRHAGLRASARDLTPLEIVLIALEVEEATGFEVPVEKLASAGTAGDLIQCFDVALSSGLLRNVA
jgi:hypothetical protein